MYRARDEAKQYEDMYGIKVPGKILADRIAGQAHMRTMQAYFRPYASSIIFATHDIMSPFALWMVEPSGACYQYYGCAAGRGKQLVRNEIERKNFRELTCEEALPLFCKILIKSQEEMKEKKQELELSVLSEATKFCHKILTRAETEKMTNAALASIAAEDEEMT